MIKNINNEEFLLIKSFILVVNSRLSEKRNQKLELILK